MRRAAALITGAIAGSLLTGAAGWVVAATLVGAGSSAAALTLAANGPSTTASGTAATTPAASTGTLHPNEDPAHEKTESAAREAQESAGQVPTVP